jgi:hypothetical protein
MRQSRDLTAEITENRVSIGKYSLEIKKAEGSIGE